MPRPANRGGWFRGAFSFQAVLPAGVGAADLVTNFVAGFGYIVERVVVTAAVAATGVNAARTLQVRKGASVMFSGLLALADLDVVGETKSLASGGVTTGGEFGDSDALSIGVAIGGTAFTAGQVTVSVVYRQRGQQQA